MRLMLSRFLVLVLSWLRFALADSFRCADGSGDELPETSVNDDFCDCKDGSDEPNTAACAGQDVTLFFCKNIGSTAQHVYASRVRDGICDCCDGSDEASDGEKRPSLTSCPNICEEEGKKHEAERVEKLRILQAGLEKRKQLLKKARGERKNWRAEKKRLEEKLPDLEANYTRLREERQARIASKKANSTNPNATEVTDAPNETAAPVAEETVDESQLEKELAKEPEKRQVSEYAKWMDGAEETVKSAEQNEEKKAEPEQKKEEKKSVSEYAAWMEGAEKAMENSQGEATEDKAEDRQFTAAVFKKDGRLGMALDFEDSKVVIHEVEVGNAADLWNKQQDEEDGNKEESSEAGSSSSMHRIAKDDCIVKVNNVPIHSQAEFSENANTEVVVLLIEKDCQKKAKTQPETEESTDLAEETPKDPEEEPGEEEREAQEVLDKNRNRIEEIDRDAEALDMTKLQYASLRGQKLEKKVNEHNYEITFFERAEQDSTRVGDTWAWTGNYSGIFTGGSQCWNGPERTISISFECGEEQELLDVSEPSRCTYAAMVAHPGACKEETLEQLLNPPTRHPRDEL